MSKWLYEENKFLVAISSASQNCDEKFHTVHYKSGVLATKSQDVRVHKTENKRHDIENDLKKNSLHATKSQESKKLSSKSSVKVVSTTPFDRQSPKTESTFEEADVSKTGSLLEEEDEVFEPVGVQDEQDSSAPKEVTKLIEKNKGTRETLKIKDKKFWENISVLFEEYLFQVKKIMPFFSEFPTSSSAGDSNAETLEDTYASLGVTFLELTNQIQNVLQVNFLLIYLLHLGYLWLDKNITFQEVTTTSETTFQTSTAINAPPENNDGNDLPFIDDGEAELDAAIQEAAPLLDHLDQVTSIQVRIEARN